MASAAYGFAAVSARTRPWVWLDGTSRQGQDAWPNTDLCTPKFSIFLAMSPLAFGIYVHLMLAPFVYSSQDP